MLDWKDDPVALAQLLSAAYTELSQSNNASPVSPEFPCHLEILQEAARDFLCSDSRRSEIEQRAYTPSWEKPTEKSVRRPVPYLSETTADTIAEYIVPANRAACGALALYEVWQGRDWSEGFMVGGGYLPGLVCFLILWARTELRIIDMDALEKLNKSAAGGKEKGR